MTGEYDYGGDYDIHNNNNGKFETEFTKFVKAVPIAIINKIQNSE